MARLRNNEVGNAVLLITPSLDDFVEKLKAKIAASQPSWPNPELHLDANLDRVRAKIERLRAELRANPVDVPVDVKTAYADAELAAFREKSSGRHIEQTVVADTKRAQAEVSAAKAAMEHGRVRVKLDVDRDPVTKVLAEARGAGSSDGKTRKVEENNRALRAKRDILADIAIATENVSKFDDWGWGRQADKEREALKKLRTELDRTTKAHAALKEAGSDMGRNLGDKPRRDAEIQRDLLKAQREGDITRINAYKEELKLRRSQEQLDRAARRDAIGRGMARALGTPDLGERERNRAALAMAGDLKENERALFRARAEGNKADVDALTHRISLQRSLMQLEEDQGRRDTIRAREAVYGDPRWKNDRQRELAWNRQLRKEHPNGVSDIARALPDANAYQSGALKQRERDFKAMEGRRGPSPFTVVMNYRGIDLFNMNNITAAVTGVTSLVSALGGVVAAAAAAATSLAAIGAVGIVGGMGVFKAFSALNASNKTDAGKDAAAEYDKQVDAIERVQDAYRNTSDKAENLRDKQRDLGESYAKATREIRDQNLELKDAELQQEASAIAVARARERLNEVLLKRRRGEASKLDVQEAQLNYRQSRVRLTQSQVGFQDKQIDTSKANAKGVAGSDTVRDAQKAASQAQSDYAKSLREVDRSVRDLNVTMQKGSASQNQFDEAMAKLTPNARKFVEAVRSQAGAWSSLRQSVESRMFKGMDEAFTRLATNQLPALKSGMTDLAGVLNGILIGSMDRLNSTFTEFTNNGTFAAFLQSVKESFSGFTPFLDGVVRALTVLTVKIGPSIGRFFEGLGKFLVDGAGMWGEFGSKTMDGITRLLPTINRMFEVLLPIAEALLPQLERAFNVIINNLFTNKDDIAGTSQRIGEALVNIADAVSRMVPMFLLSAEAAASFFTAFSPNALAGLIGALMVVRTAAKLFIGLGNSIGRMGTAKKSISAMIENYRHYASAASVAGKSNGFFAGSVGRMGTAISNTVTSARIGLMGVTAGAADTGQAANKMGLMFNRVGGRIAGALRPLRDAFSTAASNASLAFKKSMFQSNMQAAVAGQTSAIGRLLAGVRAAFVAAAAGAKAFTISLLTNPVVLIAAAIAAVVAGLVLFFTKTEAGKAIWSEFCGILKSAWDGFVSGFKKGWDLVTSLWGVFASLFTGNGIGQALTNLGGAFGRFLRWLGESFQKTFEWIMRIILFPVRALGNVMKHVPGLRGVGQSLSGAGLSGRAAGGDVPKARRDADGSLHGPGTGTSDSIVGVNAAGVPLVRVSDQEGVVNARGMQKHRGLFDAINADDPRLSGLRGLDRGGPVGNPRKDGRLPNLWDWDPPKRKDQPGSAYSRLRDTFNDRESGRTGADIWNDAWAKYLDDQPGGDNRSVNQLRSGGTRRGAKWGQYLNKNYGRYLESRTDGRRQEAMDRLRRENPRVMDAYDNGGLPPGVSVDDVIANERAAAAEAASARKQDEKNTAERAQRTREFNAVWSAHFKDRAGGDTEYLRNNYLARNPKLLEYYRSGKWPDGSKSIDPEPGMENIPGLGTDTPDMPDLGSPNSSAPDMPNLTVPGDGATPSSSRLQEAANKAVAAGEGKGIDVAVQITDPKSGQSIFAGKSGSMPSASLIKLLVAAAAADAIDSGKFTVGDLSPTLTPMIRDSNNESTNQLIDKLGGIGAVNAAGRKFGVSGADATLGRKLGVQFSGNDPNQMSARGVDQLLSLFNTSANGSGQLKAASVKPIIDAMKAQTVNTKFGAVVDRGSIAHKTGELGGASHDAGYFFDGERWVQVTIMTNKRGGGQDQASNNEIIQQFAREVSAARGETGQPQGAPGAPGAPSSVGGALNIAAAKAYAARMNGVPYRMAGFSDKDIDCSGFVAAVVNTAQGKSPYEGRMATPNEGQWLQSRGALSGRGGPGDLRIGWWDGGTGGWSNGHTAGTFPDGTNFEATPPAVRINGPVGSDHASFKNHMYFPASAQNAQTGGGGQFPAAPNIDPNDPYLNTVDPRYSTTETDKGPKASTSIADAMISGEFSPRRFAENFGAGVFGTLFDFGLNFFDMGSSIFSGSNTYWDAWNKGWAEKKRLDEERSQNRSPRVGSGNPNDPVTQRALNGKPGRPSGDGARPGSLDPNGWNKFHDALRRDRDRERDRERERKNQIRRKNGGWVSGPGGPRDDRVEALLSNKEFVVNGASAQKAGPLLEAVNQSPSRADSIMSGLGHALENSGEMAANAVSAIPGVGAIAAPMVKMGTQAVMAGAKPIIRGTMGMLSEFERTNLGFQHQAPATTKVVTPGSSQTNKSQTVDNSLNTGDIHGQSAKSVASELQDLWAKQAIARLGKNGF